MSEYVSVNSDDKIDSETSSRNPLDCLRCNSIIKHPVRLQCQHYFCHGCIAGEKACPICRRSTNCAELTEDKVLNYVVESSREVTETCANCDQTSQPMFFCDTCHQPLCNECRVTTHKAKIFSTHNIVELEERGRMRNRPFCSQHNEPFILFCLDSKSLMCIECFNASSLEKRGHFVNIDVAHKICCDKLEKNALNLRIFQDELREQIELRKRLIVEIDKNGEHLSEEIDQKCEMIIERVNELRRQLLGRIVEEKHEKQRTLSIQLNELLSFESPVSINLLSVSIFCSYASKMDVLHCYADLHKSIQQFLSSHGRQLIQKVKFGCNFNIDFHNDFVHSICQPLGISFSAFVDNASPHNMFLNCDPTTSSRNSMGHSHGCQTNGSSFKEIQPNLIITNCATTSTKDDSGNASLADVPSEVENVKLTNSSNNNSNSVAPLHNDVVVQLNTFSSSTATSHLHHHHLDITAIETPQQVEQRFLEQFQMITRPLNGFAQEISAVSKTLLDLQRDLTLRRCVVTPEELIQKITNCEDAWSRLEHHNKQVENIVNNYLKQLWRREIERIQRQQLAVREKAREIVQLRSLAKKALKVSQQLKPFATQMASLISVIDIRRTGSVLPSPMEQICSEITQIEPDSESRVAAIEKEEASRRVAKQEEMRSELENMEGLKTRRVLREVRPPTPKLRTTQLVLEMDRDRGGVDLLANNGGTTHSCLSSPSASRKRQHMQRRFHRNSDSTASEPPQANNPSGSLIISDLYEAEELEQQLSPPTREGTREKEMRKNAANEEVRLVILECESPPQAEDAEEKAPEECVQPKDELSEKPLTTSTEAPPAPAEGTAPASLPAASTNAAVRVQMARGRDPGLVQAREKLLESIREKVKRID